MTRVDTWETVAAVAMHSGKLTTANAFRVANGLDKLARIARTLHRCYEWFCNEDTAGNTCKACGGNLDRPHRVRYCAYAKVERLEKRAADIGTELGVVVTTQRDPRGVSVKIWADKEDGRMLGCL